MEKQLDLESYEQGKKDAAKEIFPKVYSFSEKQIGVDVFLTREEAEKRLKKLTESK